MVIILNTSFIFTRERPGEYVSIERYLTISVSKGESFTSLPKRLKNGLKKKKFVFQK